ncbi:MAG: hypothetical protein DRP83_03090 [Planctomycetota bacterium]|nr:MAG: hypothetical protein DRP83_03090 [Planctomycetota bacterium]
MSRRACLCATVLICLLAGNFAQAQTRPYHARAGQVQRAIDAAVEYVLSRLNSAGQAKDEYPPSDPRFGTRTLLCAYALISAEVDYRKTPKLRRAIQWAMDNELRGTYAVALRAMTLAALKDDRAKNLLARDMRWLGRAAYNNGAYTVRPMGGGKFTSQSSYDIDTGYFAALGVWASASRGVEVPSGYWKRTKRFWLNQQRPDGGWAYRLHKVGGKTIGNTYGSTTAQGVAVLSICFDQLGRREFLACKPVEHYDAINRGLEWLSRNFSAELNPRKGPEWYFRWLFALQRVGLITGRKYLGGVDWYAAGSRELLRRQQADGSWHFGKRIEPTCLALLFLTRGGAPILVNKLDYPGQWNPRPHDAANMTDWLSYNYERPLGWQVVDVDSKQGDWDDGRILYISGSGPVAMSDEQVLAIRKFVQAGGLILSEAAGNSGEFSLDMHRLYQRIFPRYRLGPLPAGHPIYTLQFSDVEPTGLVAITNGARVLAVHSSKELSRALEIGAAAEHRPIFNLLANLYMYLTDKGFNRPRGQAWPVEPTPLPADAPTWSVAIVKYRGKYDPEPAGLARLAKFLAREKQVRLKKSTPTPLEKLDASLWPVAHITGTGKIELTEAELAGMRKYIDAGGVIIADATGGASAFTASFEKLMSSFGEVNLVPQNSPIYQAGPYRIGPVRYRRVVARTMPRSLKHAPRLEAVYRDGRAVIIFSPDDLSAGLVGYPLWGLRGYTPTDARKIMANLIHHAQKK